MWAKAEKLYLIFNKPYGVLPQFTDSAGRPTLKGFIPVKGIYPAGRLDFDSEGLLFLTNDGELNHQLTDPKNKQPKSYLVQVEGVPSSEQLAQLEKGVELKDGITLPAKVKRLSKDPQLWPRSQPIRQRNEIPISWLELTIVEGKNRQVRRMTAAVGLPCLRLVRTRIGPLFLGDLQPGEQAIIKKPKIENRK